jgi:hypothetical protein
MKSIVNSNKSESPAEGHAPTTAEGRSALDAAAFLWPTGLLLRGASPQPQNELPQAQPPEAFGLSMVKPCCSIVSVKSMVAPTR